MGVNKLWQLLEQKGEGEETSLSQCSGQAWAVDLSGWILNARTAVTAVHTGISADFSMIKTVFFRALCLLKHGIRPVFVMDGRTAPDVKSQTMHERSEKLCPGTKTSAATDRSGLMPMNRMCQEMLESLGVQVLTSPGEAEKTCAVLNRRGIVDACLSGDSDTFLYGASTVYRNLDVKKETAMKHTLADIGDKLDLTREDLVLMALLSGCDYGSGVKGVGPQCVLKLVAAMKKYSPNILDRVMGWRDNTELTSLEQQIGTMTKSVHCTQCGHTGKKSHHTKHGCSVCKRAIDCVPGSSQACPCDYHRVKTRTDPFQVELSIRQKAVHDNSFPNKKLIEEFLSDKETHTMREVKLTLPAWDTLAQRIQLPHDNVMRKMIPVLVHMHLHGTLDIPDTSPESIVKECTRHFVKCYLVAWKRFAFDKWSEQPKVDLEKTPSKDQDTSDPYILAVPCQLLEARYPRLVNEHQQNVCSSAKKGKGKRRQDDSVDRSQRSLTDFFTVSKKVKKVLTFEEPA